MNILMGQAMRKFVFLCALSVGFFPVLVHSQEARLPMSEDFWETAKVQDVAEILESGADINRNDYGWTPLHFAVSHSKSPEVILLLLDAGADIEARNEDGWTPLHWAVSHSKSPEVISLLLDAGADINARDEYGNTSLHRAASRNSMPEVISLLLDAGADIEVRNENGVTPLHLAAGISTAQEVISLLLDRGANPGAKDRDGYTPFDYAKENKRLKGSDVYWRLNEGRFQ